MKRQMIASAAVFALLAAVSAPQIAYAQAKTQNVTVVNPTTAPVNARITNSVVPVEVSNSNPIPVALAEPEGSREIFYKALLVRFENNTFTCNQAPETEATVNIPVGKRLVLEYVSAFFSAPAPVELINLVVDVLDVARVLTVPATPAKTHGDPPSATNFSGAAQYVHTYFDSQMRVCASATGPTTLEVRVFLTGYLVNRL